MDQANRDHLLAVYGVERQDDASALTAAFAMATTGLTYVIAATAFLTEDCDRRGCETIPLWFPLAAPALAIAFMGFLILNVAASRMRSIHLQRLEGMIRIPVAGGVEPSFHSDAGLVYRPDNLRRKPRIRLYFALISWTSYGFVVLTLVGFTAVILVAASGPWTPVKMIVAVAYGLIIFGQIAGFAWSLNHSRFKLPPSPDGDVPAPPVSSHSDQAVMRSSEETMIGSLARSPSTEIGPAGKNI
jgi:hypothetical protein